MTIDTSDSQGKKSLSRTRVYREQGTSSEQHKQEAKPQGAPQITRKVFARPGITQAHKPFSRQKTNNPQQGENTHVDRTQKNNQFKKNTWNKQGGFKPQRQSFKSFKDEALDNFGKNETPSSEARYEVPFIPTTKMRPRRRNQTIKRPEGVSHIPPLADGDLRVVPLCGVEWIGSNMTMIEYKDEIIIIDIGFIFSDPDNPGINYKIPNTKYLEEHKEKIKAVVITHGHLDHIGAIPYIIHKIGNPVMYSLEFGALQVQKRMEEFPNLAPLNLKIVGKDDGYITISENFKIKFFGVSHSVPDSSGVIVQTPLGGIVSTGDVRVENNDGVPVQAEIDQYKMFANNKENILLLTMDSTGAPFQGWAGSELKVRESIDTIMKNIPARLFIATFASQVERIISFIDSAKKHGRYVAIDGRSMKTNIAIAEHLQLTDFKHLIPVEDVDKYPPNKVLVICTGGQGEEFAALRRLSRNEHRILKLNPSDTVILSSSVIPGNDFPIERLKDDLFKMKIKLITYADNVVHASGHGKREELRWLHKQIPAKFFMPVHGSYGFLKAHEQIALETGRDSSTIIVPECNGAVIEFRKNGNEVVQLPQSAVDAPWIVDGAYMGPRPDVVLEDRKILGTDGMFVVAVVLDMKRKMLVKSPDIASRGHTYLRESKDLLSRTRVLVKRVCEHRLAQSGNNIDFDQLKKEVNDRLAKYIMQKTLKNPIIMTIITPINF